MVYINALDGSFVSAEVAVTTPGGSPLCFAAADVVLAEALNFLKKQPYLSPAGCSRIGMRQ